MMNLMTRHFAPALFLVLVTGTACEEKEPSGMKPGMDIAAGASAKSSDDKNSAEVLFYRSEMNPSFISIKPGKDSMGMDLVPVRKGDPGSDLDTIVVNGAMVQRMGVRIAKVKRGSIQRPIRAAGRIEVDESRVAKVNTKYEGWVEKLYVNETGQKVEAGDPLFAIYSPELVASQREYAQVVEAELTGPHAEHLRKAAAGRLQQFDVSKALIDRIAKDGKTQRWIVFTSPATGYVTHKNAWQGTYVKKGDNLFTVADLNALWVIADVYEYDAPWLEKGQNATVQLDYLRGKPLVSKVDYVYPTLDETSRTLKVRLKLENPDIVLKPGMFATVRIYATPVVDALVIPPESVIHSGERNIVFVSKGGGQFEPRDVELGLRTEDAYEVLSGLKEGEDLVVSGQFLLDSESNLKEAVKKMLGSNVPTSTDAPSDEDMSPNDDKSRPNDKSKPDDSSPMKMKTKMSAPAETSASPDSEK